ncbi:MAG: SMP-30/gluconolactonase/LRE family protein, partial [Thermomicrobiales bacterium]
MTHDIRILTTSEPEIVVDMPCETGEGPLWNQRDRKVYWLDIPPGRLYRFDPETGENTVAYQH